MEDSPLPVGLAGQNKQWADRQRLHVLELRAARRGRQPSPVFLQQRPDCGEMLRFLGLEIEIEGDDWPRISMTLPQRALDERPDALEKVVPHRRFAPGESERRLAWLVVGDERSSLS